MDIEFLKRKFDSKTRIKIQFHYQEKKSTLTAQRVNLCIEVIMQVRQANERGA